MKLLNRLIYFILGMGSQRLGVGKGIIVPPGFRKATGVAVAIGGGALLSTGASAGWFGDGGDEWEQPEIQVKELPGYPEADVAREKIAGRLEEWGAQPGYGAISPDWGDIWERARGKVGRYYWGGPGETGLAGKVRAGAARRGVAESPAMETLIGRMGQQEALQLGEMGTEQALQESLFGEKGRQDWFSQMQNLAQMRPSYATTAGVSQPQTMGAGEAVGELGATITGAGMQAGQNRWMMNYLKEMLGQGQLGLADPTGGYGGGYTPSPYVGPGYPGVGPVVA